MSYEKPHDTRASLLLDQIACDVWDWLRFARENNITVDETSITDRAIWTLYKANERGVSVWKVGHHEESKVGADLMMIIGSDKGGWVRHLLQAKKLHAQSGTYKALHYRVNKKGPLQIDLLCKAAEECDARPWYCFYNYVEQINPPQYWWCKQDFHGQKLGCTVVPAKAVRSVMGTAPKAVSFDHIHQRVESKPWGCLARCPLELPKPPSEEPKTVSGLSERFFTGFSTHLPPKIAELRRRGPNDSNILNDETIPARWFIIIDVEPRN